MKEKRRYEHYVPKEHIRRFSKSGEIWVTRFDGRTFCKKINRETSFEIGGIINFYDFGDPFDPASMENQLAGVERALHPFIDEIIETGKDSSGRFAIKQYLSLLYNRSIMRRESCEFFSNDEKDMKRLHEMCIKMGVSTIGLDDIDDYVCCLLKSDFGEFITSDNPVVGVLANLVAKENGIYDIHTENEHRELIYLCPISPDFCVIMYHKNGVYPLKLIAGGCFTIEAVNTLIVHWAVEFIFSKDKPSEKMKKRFTSGHNPAIKEIRESVMRQRKIGKGKK